MKSYHKITFVYFIVGASWIFFSDRLITLIAQSNSILTNLQTIKGWLYVVLTSLLLYTMVRKSYFEQQEREKEKAAIFYKTMSAVHHILNNFLNKMMFFKVTAEESNRFTEEVLRHYDHVISETANQIKSLGEIKSITEDEIEKTAFPNLD